MNRFALALLGTATFLSCSAPQASGPLGHGLSGEVTSQAVPLPGRSAGTLEANWKERLDQPYVYLEHRADYRELGDAMRRLFSEAESNGIEPDGPPFSLFYDDPGRVPLADLRARVCLPVSENPGRKGSLQYDLLARAMVVYGRVSGAYPEAARSYPALFSYLHDLGWKQGGPVREVYLVDPASVTSYDELCTEIQIPWVRSE